MTPQPVPSQDGTRRSRNAALAFLLLLGLGACAGPIRSMREVPADQVVTTRPEPGKVTVVFLRPSTLGFGISSSVYELKPDNDTFVGIVPAKRKLVYVTAPGKTRFMVVSEAADFMAAELDAGKTYYALVTPRMGVWKARFSLRPVHADELENDLKGWLDDSTYIENT